MIDNTDEQPDKETQARSERVPSTRASNLVEMGCTTFLACRLLTNPEFL